MSPSKKKRYWLAKTEPTSFSWNDLWSARGRRTCWDGVRNYQARNFIRDDIEKGDLVLLYHSSGPVAEADLFSWVEHSNSSIYRRDVLKRAHKAKLLEYNDEARTVEISPLGVSYVEETLLAQIQPLTSATR